MMIEPSLDFETPPEAQCGTLSTIEGVISRAINELQALQEERKKVDPERASVTLGGMVMTIEGLITQIGESLDKIHGFQGGDGTEDWNKSKWKEFKMKLKKLLEVEKAWTLVIDDGLARSFVSPVTEAIEDDRQLVFEDYQRTWEQDEDLGLNDIDTAAADVFYEDGNY